MLQTSPDKMDFAIWEFVLSNGSQQDQDAVWNAIKGKAVQMNGTIISTTTTEFQIAGSSDDIDAKKADITLKFENKVPARLIPNDGTSFDFQGEPASYTSNPFMMIMENGMLLKANTAPATTRRPPVHHKPSAQVLLRDNAGENVRWANECSARRRGWSFQVIALVLEARFAFVCG